MFFVASPVYAFTWLLVMFQGLTIFAYYSNKRCDPLASGQVGNLNQIIPFTVLELFHDYPGLPGVFIAALAAASLSTISSGLSSLSAVTYEDFIKVYVPNIKENTGTTLAKVVVVVYGLIAVGFAFILTNVEGPIGQVMAASMGAITGPEAGLFLVSVFMMKARPRAVFIGTLTGVFFVLWLNLGQNFFANIPKTPYLPLGPTDKCVLTDIGNYTSSILLNNSNVNAAYSVNTSQAPAFSTAVVAEQEDITGMKTFYSISYMYFNLIGVIVTMTVSIILSLCMQPDMREPVHKHTTLPFSIFIPPFIKRRFAKGTKRAQNGVDQMDELEHVPLN